MVEKLKMNFLYMFCLIPNDMLTFVSGIYVATAINILTCRLPDSVLIIGKIYLLVAAMLLTVAFFLIKWFIYIKPIHEIYSESNESIESLGEKQCWYNLIKGNGVKKLVLYSIIITVLSLTSFIFLIYPNIIECAITYFEELLSFPVT